MGAHLLSIFLLLFLSLISELQSRTIHVPGDSTTIQGGINGAVDGDTVMVASGTYYEHDIDFLGKAIIVMSTDPEDSAVVASTIVDGDSLGSVFVFHSGEDSTSLLKGLTITGGYAAEGGGVYIIGSSPTIANNFITDNAVDIRGGGILCYSSSPTITNNVIYENRSVSGGGLICYINSSPTVSGNIIKDNFAITGGGIVCWIESYALIWNNIIAGNIASSGGALFCGDRSYPFLINNTIVENTTTGSESGGIYLSQIGSPTIVNSICWNNVSESGQEIYIQNGNPVVTYSDIMGGWPGEGNIDADPLFTNPINNDYHLLLSSPCIDAGDSTILDACIPPGLGEERSDIGAYGGEENCGWQPYNYNPTIVSPPDTLAVAGIEYYYDVEANDPDGDTLYFSLQVAPSWLSIDSVTGVISGIPPMDAIGDTTVTVLVEDAHGGSDDQTYQLIVLPAVDLTITLDGPTTVPIGNILYFSTYIQNNRDNTVEGDYWLSILSPDSAELLIPDILLNYPNPLHGQIFSYGFVDMSNQLFVPMRADTGSYQLIGRIGTYPDGIIDEESFGFQVVE